MSIEEQIQEIEKNIAYIILPDLLFEMNRKYRELKSQLKL